jgi:hypothetical protein
MRKILEKFWEQYNRYTSSIVDFQAAYNTLWRKEVWSEIHKISFPRK